jgi:chaperonin cofactor prefoldin
MDEANRAGKAYEKMQEMFSKYSNQMMDADELGQSLVDRINASEELLKLLQDADKARNGVDS